LRPVAMLVFGVRAATMPPPSSLSAT